MIDIRGKHNSAKVFTDNVDNATISQIYTLCNLEVYTDSNIRIMPDCHAGAGCTVGATMTITNAITPNLVGIDIGCGMLAIKLKENRVNLPEIDSVIHKYIPSGGNVNDNQNNSTISHVEDLRCINKKAKIRVDLAYKSLGTLGGGNHFIEIDKDSQGDLWLVIHTGSRHLGIEVCDFYQKAGYDYLKFEINQGNRHTKQEELIKKLKIEGRFKDIAKEVDKFNKQYTEKNPLIPFELAYVSGELFDDYIHDMEIVQLHAKCNREEIAKKILKYLIQFITI